MHLEYENKRENGMQKEQNSPENKFEKIEIPKEIEEILDVFQKNGIEAYLVGGCVRDYLLGKKPVDWDITTSAMPDEIQKLFPRNFYANEFGTVTVLTDSEDLTLKQIEITPYRAETAYSDQRHPDEVRFGVSLEEDLARRDFTMNAIAMGFDEDGRRVIVDPFDGMTDLKRKLIKAVGDPEERFHEDTSRLMRAVRFKVQLGFEIEEKTKEALLKLAHTIDISKGGVRKEFLKMIDDKNAMQAMEELREYGLMKYIIPELLEGVGVGQNGHHAYTVWEHNLRSLDYAVSQNYSEEVRLAALFHDIGKPRTKRWNDETKDWTFYGHNAVGKKMAINILRRLKFSAQSIDKVAKLIYYHMFIYNSNPQLGDVTTDKAMRRLINGVGVENIWDLINLRLADRAGSGVKKIEKFDNRHIKFRIENLLRDPISLKQLAINGNDVMETLKIKPGPKVGWLLNALFQEVLDDPKKNDKKYLEDRLKELNNLSDDKLKDLADAAKREIGFLEEQSEEGLKEKYFVK
jgi:poly(A) polymerase/tRNA nucleotidyltransferase (CCA-adding enzyme)